MASITDLASAGSIATTDLLVVNQSGTDRKATADKFGIFTAAAVTPTVQGSSTGGTYSISNNVSRYVKIGTLVVANYSFNITVTSAGSGYIKIDLPFATKANSIAVGACDLDGADYSSGFTSLVVKPDATASTSYCYIAQIGDNVATTYLPITALTTGDKFNFTLVYEAAS